MIKSVRLLSGLIVSFQVAACSGVGSLEDQDKRSALNIGAATDFSALPVCAANALHYLSRKDRNAMLAPEVLERRSIRIGPIPDRTARGNTPTKNPADVGPFVSNAFARTGLFQLVDPEQDPKISPLPMPFGQDRIQDIIATDYAIAGALSANDKITTQRGDLALQFRGIFLQLGFSDNYSVWRLDTRLLRNARYVERKEEKDGKEVVKVAMESIGAVMKSISPYGEKIYTQSSVNLLVPDISLTATAGFSNNSDPSIISGDTSTGVSISRVLQVLADISVAQLISQFIGAEEVAIACARALIPDSVVSWDIPVRASAQVPESPAYSSELIHESIKFAIKETRQAVARNERLLHRALKSAGIEELPVEGKREIQEASSSRTGNKWEDWKLPDHDR